MNRYLVVTGYALAVCLVAFYPALAHASVESSLMAVQTKLLNVILPLAGVLGLIFAALSFFAGNPNARTHLMLAIFGACIGFGAPSIIAFIRSMVQ